MAGGKQTPRQKLVSLMYLVFLAMMAMSMGKEVLSAFGSLKDDLVKSNTSLEGKNTTAYDELKTKAAEQAAKYAKFNASAQKVKELSQNLFDQIEGLKARSLGDKDPKDYQSMDKGDALDAIFFTQDGYQPAADSLVNMLSSYREEISKIAKPYPKVKEEVEFRFDTQDVVDGEGATMSYLHYNYEGFPLVASLAKFTQLQSRIRATESELLGRMLTGQLKADASLNNFKGIVSLDKTAFYPGDKVTGKIVLGKYDASLKPSKVIYNKRDYTKNVQGGAVVINEIASGVGERPIEGKIIFIEDGKPVEVPFKSQYSVIPKPNGAVISADKMNVVYRGLSNPLTISVPGISGNKVKASAPGLRIVKGSKYIMKPGAGSSVKINVSGTLPDGKTVSSSQVFRVKDIPPAVTMVRNGQYGNISMPKSSASNLTINAGLPDFLFDLKFSVSSFKVKVSGQPTVTVNGSRMNASAKKAIGKARRGSELTIFDVKASVIGAAGAKVRKVLPLVIKVNN